MAKRWKLAGVLLVVGLVGGSAVVIGPYLFDGNEFAGVESIERAADYHAAQRLEDAWRLPVAARYAQQPYEFQNNPSFCGPASAANLLRSFGTDLSQERVIDGTAYEPWFGILIGGLTLEELAELVRLRADHRVSVLRPASLAQFRAELALANDLDRRYIVNFHRGPLFGRGHGHFSPILGYLPEQDLVFVGDVNPDYRPFLVSSERLWAGVDTVDQAAGARRGLLVVERRSPP